MGAGEVQKKYSRKGKLNKKKLCTPINPKKYSCYGLKKIHTRNLITKKNSCASLMVRPLECKQRGLLDFDRQLE